MRDHPVGSPRCSPTLDCSGVKRSPTQNSLCNRVRMYLNFQNHAIFWMKPISKYPFARLLIRRWTIHSAWKSTVQNEGLFWKVFDHKEFCISTHKHNTTKFKAIEDIPTQQKDTYSAHTMVNREKHLEEEMFFSGKSNWRTFWLMSCVCNPMI